MACAIKSNGKILREFKDKVYLKFGSEFSIYIKNLNSVRALVNVYIDGSNVTPNGLVIMANSEIDFERSLANFNMNVGNKFKFIERTGDIENHRGIKLEDGLIRIEYQFEIPSPKYNTFYGAIVSPLSTFSTGTSLGYPGILRNSSYGTLNSVNVSNTSTNAIFGSCSSTSTENSIGVASNFNDAGITVPGSKSEQKFSTADWFPVEATKHCMVINLLGETPDNKPVVKTVTVKHKPKCTSCGSQNKAYAKFCNKCGTALTIFK